MAELDSLFFTLNLPSNIHVRGVTFGTPRVGNAAYADFFNAHVCVMLLSQIFMYLIDITSYIRLMTLNESTTRRIPSPLSLDVV